MHSRLKTFLQLQQNHSQTLHSDTVIVGTSDILVLLGKSVDTFSSVINLTPSLSSLSTPPPLNLSHPASGILSHFTFSHHKSDHRCGVCRCNHSPCHQWSAVVGYDGDSDIERQHKVVCDLFAGPSWMLSIPDDIPSRRDDAWSFSIWVVGLLWSLFVLRFQHNVGENKLLPRRHCF